MNASIHLRTTALQGVPGASAVVRGKVAAGSVAPGAASLALPRGKGRRGRRGTCCRRRSRLRASRPRRSPRRAPSASWGLRFHASSAARAPASATWSMSATRSGAPAPRPPWSTRCIRPRSRALRVTAAAAPGIGCCCAGLCNEQMLLASSTTEGQSGGDVRNSAAPIEQPGRSHHARTAGDGHLLRRGRRRHCHHGAARRRRGERRSGARGVPQKTTIRSSGKSAGMRSACAAPRASGYQAHRRRCERADPAGKLR